MKKAKAFLCMALLLAIGSISAYAGGQLEKVSDVLDGVNDTIRTVDETIEGTGGTKGGGGGGTFTVTGIPSQYNGKYAVFIGSDDTMERSIIRGAEYTPMGGRFAVRISGGSVSIPVWRYDDRRYENEFVRYTGNDMVYAINFSIHEQVDFGNFVNNIYFYETSFRNGSATVAWSAGR